MPVSPKSLWEFCRCHDASNRTPWYIYIMTTLLRSHKNKCLFYDAYSCVLNTFFILVNQTRKCSTDWNYSTCSLHSSRVVHSEAWIDAFSLPQKLNMAVTESDLDPKVHIHFLMTVRSVSWECEHVTEMSLILKTSFRPDYSRASLGYDCPKKCPTILYGVNLWLKPISATGLITQYLWIHTFYFLVLKCEE